LFHLFNVKKKQQSTEIYLCVCEREKICLHMSFLNRGQGRNEFE